MSIEQAEMDLRIAYLAVAEAQSDLALAHRVAKAQLDQVERDLE